MNANVQQILFALLVSVLMLSGCGGGDTNSSSSSSTTTTTTTTNTTNTTTTSTTSTAASTTGISDQNSFSFSANILNPEGWDYDGQPVTLTIYASDHFNNPVADGETVWFTAEGGQIDSYCTTSAGSCSATWTSSNRRPADGRVTVTAWMTGEEGFSDNVNANGMLDDTEIYTDMAEVFFDYDEDSAFDAAPLVDTNGYGYREEFLDLDGNNAFSAADGEYNGLDCNSSNAVNICSSQQTIDVRASLVLVMSGSFATTASFTADPLVTGGVGGTGSSTVTLADVNNQPLPAGTTVAVSVSTGLTLDTPATYTINSTNTAGGSSFTIGVTAGTSYPGAGIVTIKTTTPLGNVTTWYLTVA